MSELPNGWSKTSLSNLITHDGLFSDGDWVESKDQDPNGSIRLLQLADIGDGVFLNKSQKFINEIKFQQLRCTELKEGDVLVARMPQPLGRACLMPSLPQRCITVVDVAIIRPGSNSVSSQWLKYSLNSPHIRQEIELLSSGTTRQRITRKNLSQIDLPVPPLNEQRRIADKLDRLLARVDACRERCDRIPLILKRFRQSVLAAATSGELTEDWREQNPDTEAASALLKRIQDANVYRREIKVGQGIPDPFDIPSTWEWVRLFDICKSITDGDHQPPPKAETGVPFLTISNISKGRLDFNQIRYVPENYYERIDETRKPLLGDILYTAVGATYGIPVLVDTEQRFCFQRHIAILKPSHLINNKYLLYTLQSDFVYRQATDAVTGTAQPTVPLSGLRQIKVPLPPLEEQNEIAYQLEKLFAFADRLEARYKTARSQVDRLTPAVLDKAFRGELVPQDPNDEPASVLLEQIRSELATAKTNKSERGKRVTVETTPPLAQVIMLTRKDVQPSHLSAILKTRGSLAAEDLWTASQLEIDDFYDQLKDEEEQGLLRETRGEEPNAPRLLEAA